MTFPARQYSVNGERRSFALMRAANAELSAQEAISTASPTRTPASRLTPDRPEVTPGGAGLAPPPGATAIPKGLE